MLLSLQTVWCSAYDPNPVHQVIPAFDHREEQQLDVGLAETFRGFVPATSVVYSFGENKLKVGLLGLRMWFEILNVLLVYSSGGIITRRALHYAGIMSKFQGRVLHERWDLGREEKSGTMHILAEFMQEACAK